MGAEADTETTQQQTQPEGGAQGGAPSSPTVTNVPPKKPEPKAPEKKQEPAPSGGDGGGESDDFKLTREQFNERITQAKTSAQKAAEDQKRKWLKDTFGTDSDEEIEQKLQTWKEMEQEREEQKRAQMSELERAKSDLEKERKARERAESERDKLQSTYLYEKQDNVVTHLASPHVNPKYMRFAKQQFAAHLKELGQERVSKMTEKDIANWFKKDFTKEFPELAASRDDGDKPKPKQKPLSNGTPPTTKPKPNASNAGKTAKPGKANSMTKKELKEHLKSKGLAGW